MSTPQNYLKLNVGFIVNQGVGYTREFPLDVSNIRLPPDLELNELTGTVKVTRTAQGLLVQVKARSTVLLECGRCLTDFSQSIESDFTDLYAFSPRTISESGLLLPETAQIDLAPVLREEMLLAIPSSPLCKEDCLGLCPICGENRNEVTCHHDDEDIDPRFSVLKSLL